MPKKKIVEEYSESSEEDFDESSEEDSDFEPSDEEESSEDYSSESSEEESSDRSSKKSEEDVELVGEELVSSDDISESEDVSDIVSENELSEIKENEEEESSISDEDIEESDDISSYSDYENEELFPDEDMEEESDDISTYSDYEEEKPKKKKPLYIIDSEYFDKLDSDVGYWINSVPYVVAWKNGKLYRFYIVDAEKFYFFNYKGMPSMFTGTTHLFFVDKTTLLDDCNEYVINLLGVWDKDLDDLHDFLNKNNFGYLKNLKMKGKEYNKDIGKLVSHNPFSINIKKGKYNIDLRLVKL